MTGDNSYSSCSCCYWSEWGPPLPTNSPVPGALWLLHRRPIRRRALPRRKPILGRRHPLQQPRRSRALRPQALWPRLDRQHRPPSGQAAPDWHVVCRQDWSLLCHASRRSGLTKPTKDTSWLTGARPRAAASSKWSSARQGCAGGAANLADGSLNAHFRGCLEIDG